MLTEKDFEVTDPQEIIFIDREKIEQTIQEDFTDEINEISDAQEAGIYDSHTAGNLALEPFKKLFYPILSGSMSLPSLIILMLVGWYIYIARKFFRHSFSETFRKKHLNSAYKDFSKIPKIMLYSKHITIKSYDLRMQKLDKYMKYYEWETFEN